MDVGWIRRPLTEVELFFVVTIGALDDEAPTTPWLTPGVAREFETTNLVHFADLTEATSVPEGLFTPNFTFVTTIFSPQPSSSSELWHVSR
jgi:hypothetical protein